MAHSPLEEGNSLLGCFYQFLLDWMKSHEPGRLAPNTNTNGILFDFSNYDFFFTSFNLIVYLMYTAVLYYITIGIMYISVKYLIKIMSRGSKVYESINLGSNNQFIVYLESGLQKMVPIIKVILIMLFVFITLASTCLYIYYPLPVHIAEDMNTILMSKLNKSTDYLIGYFFLDIPFYYTQKFSGVLLTCILGFYRGYVLIKNLECNKYLKMFILFISANLVSYTTKVIMNQVAVNKGGITLTELFNKCNTSIELVFYSIIITIFSVGTLYILTFIKQVSKDDGLFDYNKYPLYDIVIIFIKLVTSIALFSVAQGVLFLYVHPILGDVYAIYC